MSAYLASLLAGQPNLTGSSAPPEENTPATPSSPPKKTLSFGAKKPAEQTSTPSILPTVGVPVGQPGDRPIDPRPFSSKPETFTPTPLTPADFEGDQALLKESVMRFKSLVSGTSGSGPLSYPQAVKQYWNSLTPEEQSSNAFNKFIGQAHAHPSTSTSQSILHDAIEHMTLAHGSGVTGSTTDAAKHMIAASKLKHNADPILWKTPTSPLFGHRQNLADLRTATDPNNPDGLTQSELRKQKSDQSMDRLVNAITGKVGKSIHGDIAGSAYGRSGMMATAGALQTMFADDNTPSNPLSRVRKTIKEYIQTYDFDKTDFGKELLRKSADGTLTDEDVAAAAHKWNVREFIEPQVRPTVPKGREEEFNAAYKSHTAGEEGSLAKLGEFSSPEFLQHYTGTENADTLAKHPPHGTFRPFANISDQETVSAIGTQGKEDRTWTQFDNRAHALGALFSGLNLTDLQTRSLAHALGFDAPNDREHFMRGTAQTGYFPDAIEDIKNRASTVTNITGTVQQDTGAKILANKMLRGAGFIQTGTSFTPEQKDIINRRMGVINDTAIGLTETAEKGAVKSGTNQLAGVYHPFALTESGTQNYNPENWTEGYDKGHFDLYHPAPNLGRNQVIPQISLMFGHASKDTAYRRQFVMLAKSAEKYAQVAEQLDTDKTTLASLPTTDIDPKKQEELKQQRQILKDRIQNNEELLKSKGNTTSQIQMDPKTFRQRVEFAGKRIFREASTDPAFKAGVEKLGLSFDGGEQTFGTQLLQKIANDPQAGPSLMRLIGQVVIGSKQAVVVQNTQTKRSGKNTASPTERKALDLATQRENIGSRLTKETFGSALINAGNDLRNKKTQNDLTAKIYEAEALLGVDQNAETNKLTDERNVLTKKQTDADTYYKLEAKAKEGNITTEEQDALNTLTKAYADAGIDTSKAGLTEQEQTRLEEINGNLLRRRTLTSNTKFDASSQEVSDAAWKIIEDNNHLIVGSAVKKEFIKDGKLTPAGKEHFASLHSVFSTYLAEHGNDSALSPDKLARVLRNVRITNEQIDAHVNDTRADDKARKLAEAKDVAGKTLGIVDEASTDLSTHEKYNRHRQERLISNYALTETTIKSKQEVIDIATTRIEKSQTRINNLESKEQTPEVAKQLAAEKEHLNKLSDVLGKARTSLEESEARQADIIRQAKLLINPDVPYSEGGPAKEGDYKEIREDVIKDINDRNKYMHILGEGWGKATEPQKRAAYDWLTRNYQRGTLPVGYDPLPSMDVGARGAEQGIRYSKFEESPQFLSGAWQKTKLQPAPRMNQKQSEKLGKIKVPNQNFGIRVTWDKDTGIPNYEAVEYKVVGTKRTVVARQKIHFAGDTSLPSDELGLSRAHVYQGVQDKLDALVEKAKTLSGDELKANQAEQQKLIAQLKPGTDFNAKIAPYKERKAIVDKIGRIIDGSQTIVKIQKQVTALEQVVNTETNAYKLEEAKKKLENAKELLKQKTADFAAEHGEDQLKAIGATSNQKLIDNLERQLSAETDPAKRNVLQTKIDQAKSNIGNVQSLLGDGNDARQLTAMLKILNEGGDIDVAEQESLDKFVSQIAKRFAVKGDDEVRTLPLLGQLFSRLDAINKTLPLRPDRDTLLGSGDWEMGEVGSMYVKPGRSHFKGLDTYTKFALKRNKESVVTDIQQKKDDALTAKFMAPKLISAIKRGGFGPNGRLQPSNVSGFVERLWEAAIDQTPVNLSKVFNRPGKTTPVRYNIGRFYNDVWRFLPDEVKETLSPDINRISVDQLTSLSPADRVKIEKAFQGYGGNYTSMPGGKVMPSGEYKNAWDELTIPNRGFNTYQGEYRPHWWEGSVGKLSKPAQMKTFRALQIIGAFREAGSKQGTYLLTNGTQFRETETPTVGSKPRYSGPTIVSPADRDLVTFQRNVRTVMGLRSDAAWNALSVGQRNTALQNAYNDLTGLADLYVRLNSAWDVHLRPEGVDTIPGIGGKSITVPKPGGAGIVRRPQETLPPVKSDVWTHNTNTNKFGFNIFAGVQSPLIAKYRHAMESHPLTRTGEGSLKTIMSDEQQQRYNTFNTQLLNFKQKQATVNQLLPQQSELVALSKKRELTREESAKLNRLNLTINKLQTDIKSGVIPNFANSPVGMEGVIQAIEKIKSKHIVNDSYGTTVNGSAFKLQSFLKELKQLHPKEYNKLVAFNTQMKRSDHMSLEDFTNMNLSNLTQAEKMKVRQVIDSVFGTYTPDTTQAKLDYLKDIKANKPELWQRLLTMTYKQSKLHLTDILETDWSKFYEGTELTKAIKAERKEQYEKALTKLFDTPLMRYSPIKQWFGNSKSRSIQSGIPTTTTTTTRLPLDQLPRMFTAVHAANLTEAEKQFQYMFKDWSDPKTKDQKKSNERRVQTSRIVGLVIPEVRKDGKLITPERTLHVDSVEFASTLRRMIKDPTLLQNAQFLSEQGIKIFRIGGGKLFGATRTGSITTEYDPATRHLIGDVQTQLQRRSPQFSAELLSGGRQSAKADVEFQSKNLPLDPDTVRIKKVAGKGGMPLLMIPLFAIMNALFQKTGEGLEGTDDASKEFYAQFKPGYKPSRVVPATLR